MKTKRAILLIVVVFCAAVLPANRALTQERGGQSAPAMAGANAKVLFIPLTAGNPQPPSGCTPFATIPPDDIGVEKLVIKRLNQRRGAKGLAPLALAGEMTQSARRHSNDMADNDFTGHVGSDGSDVGRRVSEACYEWERVGEIIGWGFTNVDSMVNWWMNSEPHRNLILSSSMVDVGAGYVDETHSRYRYYWTVNFGRRATDQTAVTALPYTCTYTTGDAYQGSILILHSPQPCFPEASHS